MNLTHVQTFVAAVETGNLNRTAAKLNVTQSTVTARIDALESLIGQKLLHRHKSGTELTPAGAKFLRHAEVLMQVWRQARYETSLPRGFEDVLALACDPQLWTGVAELWVRDLRQARPTIAISVEDQPGRAMVDIVLSYTPPAGAFSVDIVGEDMFIEVATVKRGLMRWDPLYVYVDLGEDFRRQHTEAFPVDETAIVTFSSSVQALDHILSCGGSAYLPYRVARPEIEAGKLFEVDGAPRFSRTVYLGRNSARTDAWPWFGEFLQEFKGKLVSHMAVPAKGGIQ